MPHEVVFRPEAVEDALEVHAWYEARRGGLGREFGQAVEALLIRIADTQVVVLAIHGRQHQSRWQSRSPDRNT